MKTYLALILMFSCSRKNVQLKECNLQNAQLLCESKMKSFHENINSLNLTTTQDSLYFHFNYHLKDSLSDGGGAYFRISKKNCKIENIRRYQ